MTSPFAVIADRWPAVSRRAAAGLCTVMVAGLLVGCAQPLRAPVPTEVSGPVRHWSGRLSLRVDSEPPEAYSAGFDLNGNATRGALVLTSPLGNALGQVQWEPGKATLQQGDKFFERPDLESLTREMGGATLPVTAMFDWLAGHESPAAGWQVDLGSHQDGRISARRLSPLPAAELKIIFEP